MNYMRNALHLVPRLVSAVGIFVLFGRVSRLIRRYFSALKGVAVRLLTKRALRSLYGYGRFRGRLAIVHGPILSLVNGDYSLVAYVYVRRVALFHLLVMGIYGLMFRRLHTRRVARAVGAFLIGRPTLLLTYKMRRGIRVQVVKLVIGYSMPFRQSR